MTVVLPISHVDSDMACKLVEWMEEIDSGAYLDRTVVVFLSKRAESVFQKISESLQKIFGRVIKVVQSVEVELGWPLSPNAMFRDCAFLIGGHPDLSVEPWYFFEPDNTPTRPGWLNEFIGEYHKAGKPYMGYLQPTLFADKTTGKIVETWPHMVGTGVYPGDFCRRSHLIKFRADRAFDIYHQGEIIEDMHAINGLLQHNWSTHTYSDRKGRIICRGNTLEDYFAKSVKEKAAVVHGCKDGTLIDVLRNKKNKLQKYAQQ